MSNATHPQNQAASPAPRGCGPRGTRISRKATRGQAIVFFVMAVVILFFMVLWNYDLHRILFVKSLAQNAGDSAALMAARWQGISLNVVGDLNILQALALAAEDEEAGESINDIQARLSYVGPMIAFMASQQAAKNNRIYNNEGFANRLREHARRVRHDYPYTTGPDGEMLFPEPYPGAWDEYASMLELIAAEGVAAGPDNASLYGDYTGGHPLLMIEFYEAVAGRNWCWFYHNNMELLEDYDGYQWWPDLPEPPHREYINSEIYGLGLARVVTRLDAMVEEEWMDDLAGEREFTDPITPDSMTNAATWYVYSPGRWSAWDAMSASGEFAFPGTGPVRPQYNYTGADAVVRISERTTRISPGRRGATITNVMNWTAAAKPFGYLNEEDPPHRYGLVLPAFHETRLIPLDASSAPSGGSYNLEWRDHIELHLEDYMRFGTAVLHSGCWYCQQLRTWERPEFRQEGRDWLALYSERCTVIPTGPGRRGGGARRAH